MFQWSCVFTSTEPTALGRRSSQELVTNTLMLELSALLKRTERLRHERVKATRRRSASVDYTWLATPRPRSSFALAPGELMELEDLCAKIPPSQCGPVILRTWKLVTRCEPGVGEVSRIFRSVLCDCLDRVEGDEVMKLEARWSQPRSKSLSFITFHTRNNPLWRTAGQGEVGDLEEEEGWSGDEEEDIGIIRRSRSMPDMCPIEEMAQS